MSNHKLKENNSKESLLFELIILLREQKKEPEADKEMKIKELKEVIFSKLPEEEQIELDYELDTLLNSEKRVETEKFIIKKN